MTAYGMKVLDSRKEIETIKTRVIKVKLSDADVLRLTTRAAKGALTVSELLQNFIGDLVDGTYSNGSDERMYADDWYERCWFAHGQHMGNTDLLHFLFYYNSGDDNPVSEFLETLEQLEELKDELLELQEKKVDSKDEKIYLDDITNVKFEIELLQTGIDSLWEKYKEQQKHNNSTLTFDEEVQIIKEWNEQHILFLKGVDE